MNVLRGATSSNTYSALEWMSWTTMALYYRIYQPYLSPYFRDWAMVPYAQWPQLHPSANGFTLPSHGSAFEDFADAFGSTSNPDVMTNLERGINGYKEDIMNTMDNPTADPRFDGLAENPSLQNTAEALTLLRLVSYTLLVPLLAPLWR
jgi:hypothetical protein